MKKAIVNVVPSITNEFLLEESCRESFFVERDRKLVVLVADRLLGRYEKIGSALAAVGQRVIFLCGEDLTVPLDWAASVLKYDSHEHALLLACKFNPVVYHVFCSWFFQVGFLFTKYRPGPVIIDDYDVLTGMIQENHPDYSSFQKLEVKTLLAADGHSCRSIETQIINRQVGGLRGVRGFFPDSCWNSEAEILTIPRKRDELHLVYQGNVYTRFDDGSDPANFHPWLARHCQAQRIHYHLYPTNFPLDKSNDSIYQPLIRENKSNPYFHLHRTLSASELIVEQRKFDAGILIMSNKSDGPETSTYTLRKYEYCMSNKIFDFFDSGLPVLIFPAKFLSAIAKRYGGAVVLKQENLLNLRDFVKGLDFDKLREGALASRQAYDHRKMGPRLVTFYDKVVEVAYEFGR
ncbi:hypothetical protein [Kiloniella laminariae]|uniref:hypothetical protein n=1 Tax=Kiloniella laminariae TaxID=454162 RepID=UPI0003656D16|nr:hypothetical protein [Kiloniella laminariae]